MQVLPACVVMHGDRCGCRPWPTCSGLFLCMIFKLLMPWNGNPVSIRYLCMSSSAGQGNEQFPHLSGESNGMWLKIGLILTQNLSWPWHSSSNSFPPPPLTFFSPSGRWLGEKVGYMRGDFFLELRQIYLLVSPGKILSYSHQPHWQLAMWKNFLGKFAIRTRFQFNSLLW